MVTMPQPITFGSLFAGIGGLDLGLERAGMACRWQVEIDDYCCQVLAKHWPTVERYEDVRTVGIRNLESVDLICGGFPCQDISSAGKRAGIEGQRSGLWSEFYRIICELRPRYVLVENVAALLVRGMDRVLGNLADGGYDAEWDCIPAAAVGAPHIRYRVFILAHRNSVNGRSLQRTNNESRYHTKISRGGDYSQTMAHSQEQPQRTGLCQGQPSGHGQRRSGDCGSEVPDSNQHRRDQGRKCFAATGSNGIIRDPWWST